MLTQDPKKQITAAQVLEHPWIKEDGEASDRHFDSAVLIRMKQFRAMNKLKKLTLKVSSSSLICIYGSIVLQLLMAELEDMPLDIVYEDAHVLVVNKPAHMVVHRAPGNSNGTLVNDILHQCSLPIVAFLDREIPSETDDTFDDELGNFLRIIVAVTR
ncbi:hypothetical protein HHK36_008732 [Tetracentron sinense]|uniref:Uncharacterized protein n=1 Tax=Tetracentron sinense TaxID=13715 RepID=A0A834ZQM7_TETSI|nr:hypothetical protein HHK36_008732 [Tetracentron sinense]